MPDEDFNPLTLLTLPPNALGELHPSMVEAIRIARIWAGESKDRAYEELEKIPNKRIAREVCENFYFILKKYLDLEVDKEFLTAPREDLPALGYSSAMIMARDAIMAWEAGDKVTAAKACVNDDVYDVVARFTPRNELESLDALVQDLRNQEAG